ncbi:CBS domain-containing protein [Streptomyces celluloflavus]|uniref:CBS domain-containing protein n=1 Tax=Streptomyces celluloflavus TaxID=58344 RepID=UPI00365E7075
MKPRRVGSVMTGEVVRALRATPREDLQRWLAEYDVGALPVVDADERVAGVVSAADLRRAPRTGGAGPPTAGELMSVPAITIRADDSLVRAARLLTEHRIGRLPVVDEEARLVGIVTRRDLLQIFCRPDADIRDEVLDEIMVRTLWLGPHRVQVSVRGGVVALSGCLESSGDAAVAVRMTRQVHGVIAVVDRLTYRRAAAHHQPGETTTRTAAAPGRGRHSGGGPARRESPAAAPGRRTR